MMSTEIFKMNKNNIISIHHISGAVGIIIQNGGKQDVFQQLQGWIQAF